MLSSLLVEKIVDKRKCNGEVQYLVQWKGYQKGAITWEPIENLSCKDLIRDFEANDELSTQCVFESNTHPNKNKPKNSNLDDRLSYAEKYLAKPRLEEEGFKESQPTPKDGNCFPEAIMDQIRYFVWLKRSMI